MVKMNDETIADFEKKLCENMVDLEPEIVHIVSDNFWDLLYYDA